MGLVTIGLPLGSRLGSSAASAAAAVVAVNEMFGGACSWWVGVGGEEFEAPMKKMRAILPSEIAMLDHIWNSSQARSLVAAVLQGDLRGLGKALSSDRIVEPKRAPLIPGMRAMKNAAIGAEAFGCTISGASSTTVAVTDNELREKRLVRRWWRRFGKKGI
ncbi:hypothetical protein GIB67_012168 [Kingdonia uniflora]|uniref:GHMP kinase C-terminal domain-containing protein n=1 Tax=Kingdonia uniflora TaxID=39325 RepID=A0A7J7NNZ8_9MAGN|nr:hypothetical protein GIB67_012168 [Kingdonia uniflora]